jgi:hypothetical protein
MPEPTNVKVGMHIMVPELISTAYFINPSLQFVCLHVYPSIVGRQRLNKNVTAARNTHATIEHLLKVCLSMRYSSIKGK